MFKSHLAPLFTISGVSVLFLSTAFAQNNPLEETLTVIEQWVETEKTISKEKADWEADEANLKDLLDAKRVELELLEEQIKKAEEETSQADQRRAELVEEREILKKSSAAVEHSVTRDERQLLELIRLFPTPLQNEIQPLVQRIPRDPDDTNVPVSQRLANIIGILTQVDKFNNTVNPANERRQFSDGSLVEVKVIYFGLAIAYYADGSGKHTGYGLPAQDKWEWVERLDLAADILEAIGIYENTKEARYVSLPVEIR